MAYVEPMPVRYDASYQLDAGDKLRVVVYGQEGLTNTYAIDAGGSITMPLIGAVPARGRTPAGLPREIAAKLRHGYIREPSVAVEIEAYRPFFILGEVAAPGQYPYVPNMTVESAIAIAGGFSPRAQRDRVTFTHTELRAGALSSCRPARRSARATPCWSASAGSRFLSIRHSGATREREPQMRKYESGNLGIRVRLTGAPGMTTLASLQMLGEERRGCAARRFGAGLVVARPLVAVKAVLRAGIDEDFDIGPLGLDGLDVGQRNARILFAEMQLRRHLRLVVGEADDGAAIIADRGRRPTAGSPPR